MSAEPTFPTCEEYTALCRAGCSKINPEAECWPDESAQAEAWAWRCADTMPDSAQGRRDSEADAAALAIYRTDDLSRAQVQGVVAACLMERNRVSLPPNAKRFHPAELAAHAAFRACPGLRA